MTAILRNESRTLLRGSVLLAGLIFIMAVFMVAVFPGIQEEAAALEDALPDYLIALLGFEELHTIEGFTAGYIVPFLWVLLIGLYFAYTTASMISGDIRSRRMDLLLANPVSRESVVLQKYTSLWVPLVVLNAVLFAVLVVGTTVIGDPIDFGGLAAMQVLSIPYLLVCGAIGLVLSVVLDRAETAQAGAIGAVFVLWLLEGVAETEPDYELLGLIAPSWYYDPTAILVHGEYSLIDTAILLMAAVVLVGAAVVLFIRRDI